MDQEVIEIFPIEYVFHIYANMEPINGITPDVLTNVFIQNFLKRTNPRPGVRYMTDKNDPLIMESYESMKHAK